MLKNNMGYINTKSLKIPPILIAAIVFLFSPSNTPYSNAETVNFEISGEICGIEKPCELEYDGCGNVINECDCIDEYDGCGNIVKECDKDEKCVTVNYFGDHFIMAMMLNRWWCRWTYYSPPSITYSYSSIYYVNRNNEWIALPDINGTIFAGEEVRVELPENPNNYVGLSTEAEWIGGPGWYWDTPQPYFRDTFDWSGINVCDGTNATGLVGWSGARLNAPTIFKNPTESLVGTGFSCNGTTCTAPTTPGAYTLVHHVAETEARQRYYQNCSPITHYTPNCDEAIEELCEDYDMLGSICSCPQGGGCGGFFGYVPASGGVLESSAIIPAWSNEGNPSTIVTVIDDNGAPQVTVSSSTDIARPNEEVRVDCDVYDANASDKIARIRWICTNQLGQQVDCSFGSDGNWYGTDYTKNIPESETSNPYKDTVNFKASAIEDYTVSCEAWDNAINPLSSTGSTGIRITEDGTEDGEGVEDQSSFCTAFVDGEKNKTICNEPGLSVSFESYLFELSGPRYFWKCNPSDLLEEGGENRTCNYPLGTHSPELMILDDEGKLTICNSMPVVNIIDTKTCAVKVRKSDSDDEYTSELGIDIEEKVEAMIELQCIDGDTIDWTLDNEEGDSVEISPDKTKLEASFLRGSGTIDAVVDGVNCEEAVINATEEFRWGTL